MEPKTRTQELREKLEGLIYQQATISNQIRDVALMLAQDLELEQQQSLEKSRALDHLVDAVEDVKHTIAKGTVNFIPTFELSTFGDRLMDKLRADRESYIASYADSTCLVRDVPVAMPAPINPPRPAPQEAFAPPPPDQRTPMVWPESDPPPGFLQGSAGDQSASTLERDLAQAMGRDHPMAGTLRPELQNGSHPPSSE